MLSVVWVFAKTDRNAAARITGSATGTGICMDPDRGGEDLLRNVEGAKRKLGWLIWRDFRK